MQVNNGLGWTFDTVADTYDKFRPGYPAELYRAIFDYLPLDDSSRAVEVGIGAGQATLPILKTGCSVLAAELGERFSALCREKFAAYPRFSVQTGKFEEMIFPDNSYDLVYAASCFHWIPEEIGYRKVFSMLKSGCAFARFANHPFRDINRPDLTAAIDELYRKYYDAYHGRVSSAPKEYTADDAQARAELALQYGFTDVKSFLFRRVRAFTADEYVSLLSTYSDHIAMDDAHRIPFFDGVRKAIESHGGVMELHDTIDLQLARKP